MRCWAELSRGQQAAARHLGAGLITADRPFWKRASPSYKRLKLLVGCEDNGWIGIALLLTPAGSGAVVGHRRVDAAAEGIGQLVLQRHELGQADDHRLLAGRDDKAGAGGAAPEVVS